MPICQQELADLQVIADIPISEISMDNYPNLLVFPNSFDSSYKNLESKTICLVAEGGKNLKTNSIVGFVGRNNTYLSIHSRFANNGKEDYFLHYMLQQVSSLNLLNLPHSINDDYVFDFLIYMFPQYLKDAVRQGIFKEYVTKNFNEPNVKGTIDLERHIKHNIPFNGNVAYSQRCFSHDNKVTQLIRHTIEYLGSFKGADALLSIDNDMCDAVNAIKNVTLSYRDTLRNEVVNQNLRPLAHPYFSAYVPLQRLCLQILRHEELKYGHEKDEVYGVLIDAAWLWEEYIAKILDGKYKHYYQHIGRRFNLFENFQQIVPDYLSIDKQIVADAKYIPLDRNTVYWEEKALAIYYKTITYMYRFCTNLAYLLYPYPDRVVEIISCKIKTEVDGVNGGSIIKIGLRIPLNCKDFHDFVGRIHNSEYEFLKLV